MEYNNIRHSTYRAAFYDDEKYPVFPKPYCEILSPVKLATNSGSFSRFRFTYTGFQFFHHALAAYKQWRSLVQFFGYDIEY